MLMINVQIKIWKHFVKPQFWVDVTGTSICVYPMIFLGTRTLILFKSEKFPSKNTQHSDTLEAVSVKMLQMCT